MPTPVALTRIISVPPLLTATAPVAGENKPVVASPLRCGLVTEAEVPSVIPAPPAVPIFVQLDPLQYWSNDPVHWSMPA
jgi:hypothetical protein